MSMIKKNEFVIVTVERYLIKKCALLVKNYAKIIKQ